MTMNAFVFNSFEWRTPHPPVLSSPRTIFVAIFFMTCMLTPCEMSIAGHEQQDEKMSVASRFFKAPNDETPPEVQARWEEEDAALVDYVTSHVPDELNHNGFAPFDSHLKGVQAVLRFWKSPEHLIKAALFHSIYGTEGFQGFTLDLKERENVQKLIGEKAERMVFSFCMIDRTTFDKTVMDWTPSDINTTKVYYLNARPEMGRFEIKLEKEDWLDFVELTLADWMEQVEGASWKANPIFFWDVGMAYSYRRLAYQKMSTILLQERNKTVAVEMYEAVMATESEETKDLHQPRTPPMSEASAAALAALRANGEDIPEDLSPSKKECLADYSGTSTS